MMNFCSQKLILKIVISIIVLCVTGCAEIKPGVQENSQKQSLSRDAENKNTIAEKEKTDEIIKDDKALTVFDKISDYLWEQAKETYSPYYQLLGFKISKYKENENIDFVEAVLNLTVFHKNFDKEPDTVEYIKEAKEKNDLNYQRYYDEYLATQEMNMELKVIIKDDEIILYIDEDPTTNRQWSEFHMSQTIIK